MTQFNMPYNLSNNGSFDVNTMKFDDTGYVIAVNDLLARLQYKYALLIFVLSSVLLFYVLWNNFVRSPSKKATLKEVITRNLDPDKWDESTFLADEGLEPSARVKKLSRAMDEYIVIPTLVLFYVSGSYLWTFYR